VPARDPGWDLLLDYDGETFVLAHGYWVKFEVRRARRSRARPHGIAYSLTLHAPDGTRLVGFDNAHPPPAARGRRRRPYDHRHRLGSVRTYAYRDAQMLHEDFWREVRSVLRERGIEP